MGLIRLKMMAISEGRNGIVVMLVGMFFKTNAETLKPRKVSGMIGQNVSKHI